MSAPHVLIIADLAVLCIPPVPVGDGEVLIARYPLDLTLPHQQEDPMPRQETGGFVGKINVPPHIGAT